MMKYCENHLSSASMVFFSHKVDICNNKDVIDGPERPTPASPTWLILKTNSALCSGSISQMAEGLKLRGQLTPLFCYIDLIWSNVPVYKFDQQKRKIAKMKISEWSWKSECVIKPVWSDNNIIPTLHIVELIIQTAADNLFINVRKEVDHSRPDQLSQQSDFTDQRESSPPSWETDQTSIN